MTARDIIHAIAAKHGATTTDVLGDRRWRHIVDARKEIAKTLRDEHGWSYKAIGRALGGRHHTTVMNLLGVFDPLPFEPRSKEAAA